MAEMTRIRFPAFDKTRIVDKHKFHVFQGACKYDVILEGTFCQKLGCA